MTKPYFDSQLYHDITTVTFQLRDTPFIDWRANCGVKIGICHLHYHPSDPFLFHSFFQRSLFPFLNFQFFITLYIMIQKFPYRGITSLVLTWRHFLAWLCLTNTAKLLYRKREHEVGLLGDIVGQNNLWSLIYSTTVLHSIWNILPLLGCVLFQTT